MGNCCASSSSSKALPKQHEEKMKHEIEANEKQALQDGLKNMANGGHQMIAGFTAPYSFTQKPGATYYAFKWPSSGSVLVTSFGVRVVANNANVEFLEGLANYATFMCHWKRQSNANTRDDDQPFIITLDNYKSVDANTGEQQVVATCSKRFLVSASGSFIKCLNLEELVDEAVELAIQAAQQGAVKSPGQLRELRQLLQQQRGVMSKGVVDDISLMWRCWVEIWTHEEVTGNTETVYGHSCVRKRRVVTSDINENKKVLNQFYDDLFANMAKEHNTNQKIFRPQIQLDHADQLQVYNSLFINDTLRPHQASYRKLTESTITVQTSTSTRAEFEGKRWVFAWDDVPELSSRAYMVSLFSEYASVGGAFHDALTEKFVDGQQKDVFKMLIEHPFTTEPNDAVIEADRNKQKIAGMVQIATGAHSMFSGLSPEIKYKILDGSNAFYTFHWPESGVVKVCALGFTLKITDSDVAFTQGLGTFIMFDVRWCPADASYGLDGGWEVFLENNILINAQSGTEEPLPEPVKHILISKYGELVKILNMDALVNYAVETAIVQKGDISAEERQAYREMLEKTQRATLTKAVSCDLNFLWASWVQLWSQEPRAPSQESVQFGLQTVELSKTHSSSDDANRQTVYSLIASVLAPDNGVMDEESAKKMQEIQVDVAKQEESYKTLFEANSIRPLIASYQKITETELSLHVGARPSGSSPNKSPVLHRVAQKEFKNSRHVFIWADVPELATKQYIQNVYQDYLDAANAMYSELKM